MNYTFVAYFSYKLITYFRKLHVKDTNKRLLRNAFFSKKK